MLELSITPVKDIVDVNLVHLIRMLTLLLKYILLCTIIRSYICLYMSHGIIYFYVRVYSSVNSV